MHITKHSRPKSNEQILELLTGNLKNKDNSFTDRNRGRILEFYISSEITEAEDYADMFDTIRNASENDIVKFYVNSPGGDLFTTIQFLVVISECDATTVCSVEGACHSAATLIALACDVIEIAPHSSFMFHNYSSGVVGKGGEQFDQITFEKSWSEEIFRDSYKNVLTPIELTKMFEGKDIWLSAGEVFTRLQNRKKLQEEDKSKA